MAIPTRPPRQPPARRLVDSRLGNLVVFGQRFADLRNERGLSQSGLGHLVNVDDKVIGAYENARRIPSAGTVQRLARALATKPARLIGLGWTPPPRQPAARDLLELVDALRSPRSTGIWATVNNWVRLLVDDAPYARRHLDVLWKEFAGRRVARNVARVADWQLTRWYAGRIYLRAGIDVPLPLFIKLTQHVDETTSLNACHAIAELALAAKARDPFSQHRITALVLRALQVARNHPSELTRQDATRAIEEIQASPE